MKNALTTLAFVVFLFTTSESTAQPALFYTSADTVCSNIAIQFTTIVNDAASYAWDFGDDSTSSAAIPGPKAYASAGSYTISLNITTNPGQFLIDTITVLGIDGSYNSEFPFLDFKPDIFIRLKNTMGDVLYTSRIVWDCNLPCHIPTTMLVENGSYVIEILDSDLISTDELGFVLANNPTVPTTYTFGSAMVAVDPMDANDTYSWSREVVVLPKPFITMVGDSLYITFDGGGNPFTPTNYRWYFNGMLIPGSDSPSWYPTQAGSYQVQITNSRCSTISEPFTTTVSTSTPGTRAGLFLRPNPVSRHDRVTLQWGQAELPDAQVKLIDCTGRICYQNTNPPSSGLTVDLATMGMEPGLYFWVVTNWLGGVSLTGKMVVF
ncbi:MAG: hypothetical protein IT270_14190 [Saprospiraceae bacterium]|nr:hypothetical protein [Saprospiraceae bacterium]